MTGLEEEEDAPLAGGCKVLPLGGVAVGWGLALPAARLGGAGGAGASSSPKSRSPVITETVFTGNYKCMGKNVEMCSEKCAGGMCEAQLT